MMRWYPGPLAELGELRGFVAVVRLSLTPIRDVGLPPFTSATMKSILMKAECLSSLARLYMIYNRAKPVTIRALKSEDGKPLFADKGRMVRVRRGERLVGELGFYLLPEDNPMFPVIECNGERVKVGHAEFLVETLGAEVLNVEKLGSFPPQRIILDLLTPLLLPVKLFASARAREALKGVKAYRLLPSPGYILGEAARQAALLAFRAEPKVAVRVARRTSYLLEPLVAEVDFRLKPITVSYGRDRRVRGVVGRIVFEPLVKHFAPQVWGLVRFAGFIGLGKSRSVGFGEVRVSRARGRLGG